MTSAFTRRLGGGWLRGSTPAWHAPAPPLMASTGWGWGQEETGTQTHAEAGHLKTQEQRNQPCWKLDLGLQPLALGEDGSPLFRSRSVVFCCGSLSKPRAQTQRPSSVAVPWAVPAPEGLSCLRQGSAVRSAPISISHRHSAATCCDAGQKPFSSVTRMEGNLYEAESRKQRRDMEQPLLKY